MIEYIFTEDWGDYEGVKHLITFYLWITLGMIVFYAIDSRVQKHFKEKRDRKAREEYEQARRDYPLYAESVRDRSSTHIFE